MVQPLMDPPYMQHQVYYFTADAARKLAGRTVEQKVLSLLDCIKEIATNKGHVLRTGYDFDQDEDLWIQGGYSKTEEWTRAKNILEHLGFKVTFYYQELSMAVDLYTLIEW